MSGGGGEGIVAKVAGMGNQNQAQSGMPAYGSKTTSPSANRYNPTYAPMQQSSQQTPLQQSPQQNVQDMGLEALYQSMASQYAPISQQQNPMDQFYQQPMQQAMPSYGNSYRPDMSGISGNLKRIASPVTDQQMHPERYVVEPPSAPEVYRDSGGAWQG